MFERTSVKSFSFFAGLKHAVLALFFLKLDYYSKSSFVGCVGILYLKLLGLRANNNILFFFFRFVHATWAPILPVSHVSEHNIAVHLVRPLS